MGLAELNNDQVHAVAAHLLVAEIIINTRLAAEVQSEERRYRLRVGPKRALVQVFSCRSHSGGWQISDATRPLADDTEAVVFMNLSSRMPPDCYVVPAAWFRQDLNRRYKEFLEKHGRTRPQNPDSRHTAVQPSHIAEWHARWDVLREL